MASATETVKECRVCALNYVNPRLLPCHHPLCKACVDRLTKNGRLECPTCRRQCTVREVVADFRLDEFLQAFKEQEEYFNKIINEPIMTGSDMCELCGENAIAFRCEDCAQWICSGCRRTHLKATISKTHRIENLSTKTDKMKVILAEQLRNLKRKITDIKQIVDTFQGEIRKTQGVQLKSLQASRKLRETCLSQVNTRFDSIDDQILGDSTTFITNLEKQKEKNRLLIQNIETVCAEIDQTIKEESQHLAVKGEAILKEAKQLTENIKVKAMHIESLDVEVLQGQLWNATEAVKININQGEIDPQVRSLGSLGLHRWKCTKTLPLSSRPLALHLIQNQLWQCSDDGIFIYDDTLSLKKVILRGQRGNVYDVCSLPSGKMMIATLIGLFTMDFNGENLVQISRGKYTGVVFDKGRVYAAEIQSPSVHIYNSAGGRWKQEHEFQLNASQAWIVTLQIYDDTLRACLSGDDKLAVFSLDGRLLRSFGSSGSGSGKLNDPFVCSTDQNGSHLVADRLHNRFQVVDGAGSWQSVNLEPTLSEPRSGILLNGKLYLASWCPYKLGIYEACIE